MYALLTEPVQDRVHGRAAAGLGLAELERGRPQRVRVVAADGALAGERLRPASADPWSATCPTACSTPAGAPAAASAVRRQVLEAALPAWLRVLRPGSGAWLAWNARILPRRRLVELMRAAGLETLEGPPCDGCAHRVDQAIQRDVLVASRP